MAVHACQIVPDNTDGHGRHIALADDQAPVMTWRAPRADDPVATVLETSCSQWLDVVELLCATEYGSYLIRLTTRLAGLPVVHESHRREDDETPMRELYEQIMTSRIRLGTFP